MNKNDIEQILREEFIGNVPNAQTIPSAAERIEKVCEAKDKEIQALCDIINSAKDVPLNWRDILASHLAENKLLREENELLKAQLGFRILINARSHICRTSDESGEFDTVELLSDLMTKVFEVLQGIEK